ncbi:MAG: 30S ribosome-binding factor RbfA [Gammaproteobacteria bacterium]
MAREYGRNQRVADQVQRELAVVIQRELTQELGMITLSATDVSPDMKNAKVYFTFLQQTKELDAVALQARLNDMAGHFRHHLAKTLPLKMVPRLTFIYDESIERANRLNALLDSVKQD